MDKTGKVEVAHTRIEHFDCGCTTTTVFTRTESDRRKRCIGHDGLIIRRETTQVYLSQPPNSTPSSVAHSTPTPYNK